MKITKNIGIRDASFSRSRTLRFALLMAVLCLLSLPGPALATVVHPFKETFGSTSQPTFATPRNLAVDQSTGNLLVVDASAQTLSRFKPNGEAAPFTALGTNIIDAKKGPVGKICSEEAASCDETPQNAFVFGAASEVQIAIDNSTSPLTKGNIYVTQKSLNLIDIFGSDGHYLGQLTQYQSVNNEVQSVTRTSSGGTLGGTYKLCKDAGFTECTTGLAPTATSGIVKTALESLYGAGNISSVTGVAAGARVVTFGGALANIDVPQMFCNGSALTPAGSTCAVSTTINGGPGPAPLGEICGVAVGADGSLFVSDFSKFLIHKFVPTTNPPTPADIALNLSVGTNCAIAAGVGSTAGSLFADKWAGSPGTIGKLDSTSGALKYQVASGTNTTVTVDPQNGHVLVAAGNVVTEYDASDSSSASQISTLTATSAIQGVAVNGSTGNVYVSRTGATTLEVFGPNVATPTVLAHSATEISTTKATLNGSVNAEGDAIDICKFEYLTASAYAANGNSYSGPNIPQSKPCAEEIPVDGSAHPVSVALSALQANTTYHYRLFAENSAGFVVSSDRTFASTPSVVTGAASAIGETTATVNGTVNPVGLPLLDCKFEYLAAEEYALNGNGYLGPKSPKTKPCTPSAASIESDFQFHAVSAALAGLSGNTTYHFRLSVTTSAGTISGDDATFMTLGPPLVTEVLPLWIDKTTATLQAKVDPRGSATSYHFEWGADATYGHRVPADFDAFVGSGSGPVAVSANLSGLTSGSKYHFRVVATNPLGQTVSSDRSFETLNSCGLVEERCFELVSPVDKGPVGEAGGIVGLKAELFFQAATSGDRLAYVLGYGLPTSTAGEEVLYRAERSSSGWHSSQLSPPALETSVQTGNAAVNSRHLWLSDDLDCGFVVSAQRLTPEPSAATVVEGGGMNLYRHNADDSYTLVSNLSPTNPNGGGIVPSTAYTVVGASANCDRVVFQAPYQYPGLSPVGGFYEWSNGVLSNPGLIPSSSGDVPVAALPGAKLNNTRNAVSAYGSRRTFFTATRQKGDGPAGAAEINKRGIFVRENGTSTIDVSQSQTLVPDNGALYQIASEDGSRVFFTANYGLTATPLKGSTTSDCTKGTAGNEECDLYEYDFAKPVGHRLTNLSGSANLADTAGARVVGVLDASPDGSHVYFAAQGQLVAGMGNTYAQNAAGSGAYNIYLSSPSGLSFVANVSGTDLEQPVGLLVSPPQSGSTSWASRSTPDGGHLLFQSRSNITGYQSGGVIEAYLYSKASGATVCISCRRDGAPSVGNAGTKPLSSAEGSNDPAHPALSMSTDGSRVFFKMPDPLAVGARADEINLYEWHEGQISLLVTELPGVGDLFGPEFAGASPSGDSVFFRTKRALVAQDVDERQDIYVARVGGGFAPPASPTACDPLSEASCQKTSGGEPPAPAPASSIFSGTGNAPKSTKHKKHKAKKHKAKKHKRNVKTNGRAAK